MTTKHLTAVRQSYIVAAHAHAQRLGLKIGDCIEVRCGFDEDSGVDNDNEGCPLPPGCSVPSVSRDFEGAAVTFRGISEIGDFVVDHPYTDAHTSIPYTLVSTSLSGGKCFTLNDDYEAELVEGGRALEVGCQRIAVAKVRELIQWIDENTVQGGSMANEIPANPTATYVPPAPKKKAAKKAAKKAVKKAAKKTTRKRAR